MADDSFDIDGLANYLHLTRGQIGRLVERGKLPGRKVSGEWRFSRAEIHHWLEERIGLSGEIELAQVEGALERSAAPHEPRVSLAELLSVDAIAVPLNARTRTSVIREMTQLAAHTGHLWDTDKMSNAIHSREAMHPTAMDNGVALLHPRRPLPSILGQAFLALGITPTGIPFGSGAPLTDIFFLICSIDDGGHLRTLARLSRVIGEVALIEQLRRVQTAQEAYDIIVARDEEL